MHARTLGLKLEATGPGLRLLGKSGIESESHTT